MENVNGETSLTRNEPFFKSHGICFSYTATCTPMQSKYTSTTYKIHTQMKARRAQILE